MSEITDTQLNEFMKKEVNVAIIDREALRHNYQALAAKLQGGAMMTAVVKADAYGHGAVEVAKIALENGASRLAVARFSEAVELREAGIEAPILLLGSILPHQILDSINYKVIVSVNSFSYANLISEIAGGKGQKATVHIKMDTGMGRLGICADSLLSCSSEVEVEEAVKEIQAIAALPNLIVDGMYTHFASSDSEDKSYALRQFELFHAVVKAARAAGVSLPVCHCANSAATIEMPQTHLDMCRPGVVQYGLWPSHEVDRSLIDLKPALSWYTTILHIKKVPENFNISYGSTYQTPSEKVIATIALGYADGFSRANSNKGVVLVNGKRCPIVGRVCMDLCMIDVTDVDCLVGDKVVIIGKSGNDEITAEEIADRIGTINYEVVTCIGKRIPRIYIN